MDEAEFSNAREDGKVAVVRVSRDTSADSGEDFVAVEEPLEIRLGIFAGGTYHYQPVSLTMRTPGNDLELAAGFLFTEGILRSKDQIKAIEHCHRAPTPDNTVRIDLAEHVDVDLKKLERHFYTSSSCGVCGKTSIESLSTGAYSVGNETLRVIAETIHSLPETLRKNQSTFERTGGLHAAGLFTEDGALLSVREDVGRHNAVDKLVGERFLSDALPLNSRILFLSGRASFELVQKAVMAGIPIVCAVGAPSSLAISAAKEFGVTLLGFVRDGRFNIYAGGYRIKSENAAAIPS